MLSPYIAIDSVIVKHIASCTVCSGSLSSGFTLGPGHMPPNLSQAPPNCPQRGREGRERKREAAIVHWGQLVPKFAEARTAPGKPERALTVDHSCFCIGLMDCLVVMMSKPTTRMECDN